MKRVTTTLLLAALCLIGAQAQLLFKISGNGLARPSYIIGTYHVAPSSFIDSIPGVHQVLAEVGQVYGELDMEEEMKPENLQKMQAAMMLPEGKTLTSLLSEDEMTRFNALLRKVIGGDMTNPMIAQQLGKMSPAALSTQLTMLSYIKKTPGFNPADLFDSYFQKIARQQGKTIGGLENMDFQIELLCHSQSIERQKELLMCQIDHWDFMEEMTEEVTKAFFSQDINAIKEAIDMKQGNACDATPEEEQAMVDGRNANWVRLMPDIMQAKPTLFAVGAAHLPGEKGVLHLLQAAGYTVEAVK